MRMIVYCFCRNMSKEKIISIVKNWGQPVSDRVIIVPEETEKETASGLFKASTKIGDDNKQIGEVIAIGPGKYSEYTGQLIPMQTKVGQKVLFSRHAGDRIYIDEDGRIYPGIGDRREEWLCIVAVRQEAVILPISNDE